MGSLCRRLRLGLALIRLIRLVQAALSTLRGVFLARFRLFASGPQQLLRLASLMRQRPRAGFLLLSGESNTPLEGECLGASLFFLAVQLVWWLHCWAGKCRFRKLRLLLKAQGYLLDSKRVCRLET